MKAHVTSALAASALVAAATVGLAPTATASSHICEDSGAMSGENFDNCFGISGHGRYVDYMHGYRYGSLPNPKGCKARVRIYYASNGDSRYGSWVSCSSFKDQKIRFDRDVAHGKYCSKIQLTTGGAIKSSHPACETVHD